MSLLLALATALLANPSILFIEEPTHELGTSSAEKIAAKLLAFETGLTVTGTLHHPSTHFDGLFACCISVADVSCVYDGKASDAVAYFNGMSPEYTSRVNYFML
ncbi:P-loop containing nucleoside triphosphate hydrolase [Phytophthora cactorum]|nr:P-loop containing nucleoside triphosphate hydrolase [Phytophthora cactorum]